MTTYKDGKKYQKHRQFDIPHDLWKKIRKTALDQEMPADAYIEDVLRASFEMFDDVVQTFLEQMYLFIEEMPSGMKFTVYSLCRALHVDIPQSAVREIGRKFKAAVELDKDIPVDVLVDSAPRVYVRRTKLANRGDTGG